MADLGLRDRFIAAAPFRFFDLLPELRDQCYDYMAGPTVPITAPNFPGPQVSVRTPPLYHILRAGKQIRFDYQKRIKEIKEPSPSLIFSDHSNNHYSPIRWREIYYKPFVRAKHADYYAVLRCTSNPFNVDGYDDVSRHWAWINYITSDAMCNLTTMHVYLMLHCEPTDRFRCLDVAVRLERFTKIKCVTKLEVHRGRDKLNERRWNEIPDGDRNALCFRWAEGGNWEMRC